MFLATGKHVREYPVSVFGVWILLYPLSYTTNANDRLRNEIVDTPKDLKTRSRIPGICFWGLDSTIPVQKTFKRV